MREMPCSQAKLRIAPASTSHPSLDTSPLPFSSLMTPPSLLDPTAPPIGMTPSASSPRSYSFSSDMEEDEEAASSSMHGPTSTGRPSLSHSSSSSSSNGVGGLKHASWETVVVTRKKKNKPLVSLPLMEGKWANSPPSSSSEAETPAAAAAGMGKPYDPAGFEFFCDACHYTLVEGEVRYVWMRWGPKKGDGDWT